MSEYKGALNDADEAAVFYSKHALELKRMPELKKEAVEKVARAVEFADASPLPDSSELFTNVYAN